LDARADGGVPAAGRWSPDGARADPEADRAEHLRSCRGPVVWRYRAIRKECLMDQWSKMSRRAVLKRAVVLAGTAVTASVLPDRQASAQQKVSKEAMKYQDKPNGDKMCSNCLQFVPPASCKVVEGTISPNGYCLAWVKKA
jgi:hypothetical protein